MNILPKPFRIDVAEGSFAFRADGKVATDLPAVAALFGGADAGSNVRFVKGDTEWDYVLKVTPKGVAALASTDEGLFHAAVTLLQMAGEGGEADLPACTIYDKPRFGYRAGMIDVSRHFFGVETVKKLIDTMALFKFNRLHFHVSDDQGFRLRIDALPKLHQIGSERKGTCGDGKPAGGYYTKAQIKELVDYAAARYIEIVPEIDLPGHTRAIVAAYPELSCSGKPTEVASWFGIHSKILCTGKDKVYEALDKIFAEMAEMFPSPLFHLGGDEVAKLEWAKCPDCAAVYKREGLKNLEELQGYFTNRVIKMLKKYGKTPILWNEALKSDMLDESAMVQYWTTDKPSRDRVLKAVNEEGRQVIMSRCNPYYLDYPCGTHSLKAMYMLEPADELGVKDDKGIFGVECPLWTEHVADEETLFKRFYPRALAVAETGWSAPGSFADRGVRDEDAARLRPDVRAQLAQHEPETTQTLIKNTEFPPFVRKGRAADMLTINNEGVRGADPAMENEDGKFQKLRKMRRVRARRREAHGDAGHRSPHHLVRHGRVQFHERGS